MKLSRSITAFTVLMLIGTGILYGERRINFQFNIGETAVDFEQLLGYDYWTNTTPETADAITQWETDFYKLNLQILNEKDDNLWAGLVLGANHLYYWEYRVYDPANAPWGSNYVFFWNNTWTAEVGYLVEYHMDDNLFFQAGGSVHWFFTSYGFAPAVMASVSYNLGNVIPGYEDKEMSLQFRYDIIFAEVMMSCVNYGFGVTF